MDGEIEMALLLGSLTPEQVAEIVPPYPEDKPVIVPGFQVNAESGSQKTAAELQSQYFSDLVWIVKNKINLLDKVSGPRGIGIGSNSWVISGDSTATGMPLLANDPHLGAQMPAIWYEVGLHCTERTEACPYQVTGFSFAGVPGVVIGHNEHIAWGFTNVGPDVQDLYIEKINPETILIARGCSISAPSPRPSARGSMPTAVVNVVISMGRRRVFAASIRAALLSMPRS